jgi:hypothetical protein
LHTASKNNTLVTPHQAKLAEEPLLARLGLEREAIWRRTRLAYMPPCATSASCAPLSATEPLCITTMECAVCTVLSLQMATRGFMAVPDWNRYDRPQHTFPLKHTQDRKVRKRLTSTGRARTCGR